MKTGKLFAGVALATLTAACTNEVMQLEPQAPEADNRPMVNVQLSFDEDAVEMGKTDTRLTFENGNKGYQWYFKDGDKIGALLMDEWDRQGCGIKHFSLVDYVHTNYAFIRKTKDGETKWVTPEQAPVCEGNYFFYFPYNDAFAHRGYVAWDINPVQLQSDSLGNLFQMQAVMDNQKWIGYKFVSDQLNGKVNEVNFDFVPVFAMPAFHIENGSAYKLKVNRLVVRCTSNDSPEQGQSPQINPSGEHELMATTMALTPDTRNFAAVNETWESLSFEQKTANMWKKAQSYTYNSEQGSEQYQWPYDDEGENSLRFPITKDMPIWPLNTNHSDESIRRDPTYEYVADFTKVKGGYWVNPGQDIGAMLVMPGGLYVKDNKQTFEAVLYVTSEYGKNYFVRIDFGQMQTQGATNTSGYDDIISGAANKFLKPGLVTNYSAMCGPAALQSYAVSDAKLTSTEDLLWILDEAKGDGIYDLCVTTSGSRVVLNDSVAVRLLQKPYIRLHVNGEITINVQNDIKYTCNDEEREFKKEDAINLLYFNNPNMKTTLNIINKQIRRTQRTVDETNNNPVKYTVLGNCEIHVGKDGELITIVNDDAQKLTEDYVTIKGDVYNEGTIFTGDITGSITNSGSLTGKRYPEDNKDKVLDQRADAYDCIAVEGDFVSNTNEMVVKSINVSDDVTNNKTLKVGGMIAATNVTNYGPGVLTAASINATSIKNSCITSTGALAELKATGDVTGHNIYNDGKLTVGKVTGSVTNNVVRKDNGDEIKNSGVAEVAGVTETVTNTGSMKFNEGTYYHIKNSGTINIESDKCKFMHDLTGDYANKGTLKVNATTKATIDVENKATINIKDGMTFQLDKITNYGTITVGKGAKLITTSNEKDLIINNGTIENSGDAHYIQNNGKIVVKDPESHAVITGGTTGMVNNTVGGYVSYDDVPEQTVWIEVDATGLSYAQLNEKIEKAHANKLVLSGTINMTENWSVVGYTDFKNKGYFAKGVELNGLSVYGNKLLAIYTNGVQLNKEKKMTTNTGADVAFLKTSSEGTVLTLCNHTDLTIEEGTTVRGGQSAALKIKGSETECTIHRFGSLKYLDEGYTESGYSWSEWSVNHVITTK